LLLVIHCELIIDSCADLEVPNHLCCYNAVFVISRHRYLASHVSLFVVCVLLKVIVDNCIIALFDDFSTCRVDRDLVSSDVLLWLFSAFVVDFVSVTLCRLCMCCNNLFYCYVFWMNRVVLLLT